jgi:hypothetical protein
MNIKNIIHFIFFINMLSCSHKVQNPIFLNSKKEITIAFVGDVILHERIRKREEKTNEGYQVIWQDIQHYLNSTNYTYANLEGPVAPEIGGFGTYPMFNFPEKIIANLKDSGFDIVSTANNHALDRGAAGIKQTIKNLNKHKLKFTGTISSAKSDENFWTLTDNIAWLACTEMTNGMRDKENLVLYCFKDREKIKNIIQDLSARDDVAGIIVMPHWGIEDKFKIADYRKKWAQEMVDLGASAIVGSHPHVIQQVESLKSAGGRNAVVNYSLGNFVSNQRDIPNRFSEIFYLKFEIGDNQKLIFKEAKVMPLWLNRTIAKDFTAIYRLSLVWNFKKLPKEVEEIWQQNIKTEYRFKDEAELKQFNQQR